MHRRSAILSVVRLRAALEKDRLQIFAQRIVPLQDLAKTSGIECLARLVAEDGEAVPPTDFIFAAQRYQLSRAIDEWVVGMPSAWRNPTARCCSTARSIWRSISPSSR